MENDKIAELEARLAEANAKLVMTSGTEESKYVNERFVAFIPGSLHRIPGSQKLGVQTRCMAQDPEGEFVLEKDFVPYRKEKDGTKVSLPYALKAGTKICGKISIRATSDLHQSFFCPEHKSLQKNKSDGGLLKEIEQLSAEIARLKS